MVCAFAHPCTCADTMAQPNYPLGWPWPHQNYNLFYNTDIYIYKLSQGWESKKIEYPVGSQIIYNIDVTQSTMRISGLTPNSFTCAGVLISTAGLQSLVLGQSIHGPDVKTGLESDIIVGTTMLDKYAKCGSMIDSYKATI